MRFDPDDQYVFFSKEQEITPEESAQIQQKLLSSVFKPPSSEKVSPLKTALTLIIIIGFFLAFIITGSTGHVGACVFIFGLIFFTLGVYMLVAKPTEIYTSKRNDLKQSQNATFVLLLGALIMAIPLLIKYFSEKKTSIGSSNIIVAAAGLGFILCGGFFLVSTVAGLIKSSSGFGVEAEGECIGYIRTFNSDKRINHKLIVSTPVYEYYYDGQYLQAIGSEVYYGAAPIAVGERRTVNVDPSDPYDIHEQSDSIKPGITAIMIIFPSIFIVAGLFLAWFGLTHDIEPSAVKVANGKSVISDSYVQEKYGLAGEDWYIAEYTVTEITQDPDGTWIVELSDGSFRTDPDGSFRSSHSVGDSFYEVTDSSGAPVVMFSTDDWVYTGSKDCKKY
ncbi:MAG: hypothetical protein IJ071_05735 [Ruminococcus sp.]|nr:hypothetical protein [Ruminococcus sp.]